MSAGELLARVRGMVGLTQGELAHRAGTSRPTVSAYEHGRKSPSVDTLERLLGVAGFALDVVPVVTWSRYPMGRGRMGWVPSTLWRVPVGWALGVVELPLHLNWSDPGRRFDGRDRRERARLYEVVLREGTPQDLLRFVDGALLVEMWGDLVLPRAVRAQWDPVIYRAVHERAVHEVDTAHEVTRAAPGA